MAYSHGCMGSSGARGGGWGGCGGALTRTARGVATAASPALPRLTPRAFCGTAAASARSLRARASAPRRSPAGIVARALGGKELMSALAAVPGPKRFIVVGEGAILEATSSTPGEPSYTDIPGKGTLATFSTDDKSFEAHVYVDRVGWVQMKEGTSKATGAPMRSIRLLAPDESPLMTVVVGEEGAAAWGKLKEAHGELALVEADAGDALFSFSDA